MLPKKNRLNLSNKKDKVEYKTVLETEEIKVKYKEGTKKSAAVIVSKAVAKKAVDRNRIKRLMLQAYSNTSLIGEFIFIIKKNIANTKTQEQDALFEKITKKLSS